MPRDITLVEAPPRPTLVIPATTTWPDFPALWPALLGEVWACLRSAAIDRGCPNLMLYLDDTPRVEVGVLLDRPIPLTGRVVTSTLPTGRAATTVHRGPYSALDEAHAAIHTWCATEGLRLTRVRWEIYGPHREDPADLETQLFWLLA